MIMSNAGDHVVQKLQMWVFMYMQHRGREYSQPDLWFRRS